MEIGKRSSTCRSTRSCTIRVGGSVADNSYPNFASASKSSQPNSLPVKLGRRIHPREYELGWPSREASTWQTGAVVPADRDCRLTTKVTKSTKEKQFRKPSCPLCPSWWLSHCAYSSKAAGSYVHNPT